MAFDDFIDILRPTTEERCAVAMTGLQLWIDRAASAMHERIHRDFTRTRVRLGLKRMLEVSKPYRVPSRFLCPECGGRILIEIDEWSTEERVPTPGGFQVMCEPDTDAMLAAWERGENYDGHRYGYGDDWMLLERAVGRWLVRNVEVVR